MTKQEITKQELRELSCDRFFSMDMEQRKALKQIHFPSIPIEYSNHR